jgi:hypothetical protein
MYVLKIKTPLWSSIDNAIERVYVIVDGEENLYIDLL